MSTVNEKKKGLKQKILHELIKYWLIVLYMAIFFGAFTSYRRLLLAHYGISYEDYGISVIRALVLAKVVLVAEALHLGRGYEDKPMIFDLAEDPLENVNLFGKAPGEATRLSKLL